tara:strand:+ start:315 stop:494 length:180 start_codon:yes stop_codon:yes gene_type:complete
MIRIETIIATLESIAQGTTDMLDQIALYAAIEFLKDTDAQGIQILNDEEMLEEKGKGLN